MVGHEVGHERQRRQRIAGHYLFGPVASRRLETTLSLAAAALGFPHAQVNIFDDTLQHTISDFEAGGRHDMPRDESMCQFTLTEGVLGVGDLTVDERFGALPGVQAGLARSYLGAALHSREGQVVGTLCVFDLVVREITDLQRQQIRHYADIIEDQLEVMRRASEQGRAAQAGLGDVVQAIEHGEIQAWYQPVVDLETDRVVGFEALARWQHPDGTVAQPGQFIPVAEDSDLILDLDYAVLTSALDQLKVWQADDPRVRLALNMSTRHLEIPGGIDAVHREVRARGIRPESIDIELTETRAMAAGDLSRAAVARLRERGYGVLLDDFGSGWSSLDWIIGLPITGVKVDRAVTSALGTSLGDAVGQAIETLATRIELDLVIEGIANREQADRARALGYRYAQGYYWTEPVPAEKATAWLAFGPAA